MTVLLLPLAPLTASEMDHPQNLALSSFFPATQHPHDEFDVEVVYQC